MSMRPPTHVVADLVARTLAEDLEPLGDLTASLLDQEATAELVIVAREPGVIAGQDALLLRSPRSTRPSGSTSSLTTAPASSPVPSSPG